MNSYSCNQSINLINANRMLKGSKIELEERKKLMSIISLCKKTGSYTLEFNVKKESSKCKAIGRMYSKKASLQSLKSNIRKALVHDKYTDIDIKNAHPVFLNQIFKKENIVCNSLEKYVNERDTFLKIQPKMDWIALMNGGLPKLDNFIVKSFYHDIQHSSKELFEKVDYINYLKIAEGSEHTNALGYAISGLCTDIERKCISQCIRSFQKIGYKTGTIMHDGLLIESLNVEKQHLEFIQNDVKRYVGIDIELVEKSLKDYDPNELWENNTEFNETEFEANDETEARLFLKEMIELGHQFVSCGNECYFYNCETGLWTDFNIKQLRSFLISFKNIAVNYRGFAKKQDNIFIMLRSIIDVDNNFMLDVPAKTFRKIPFNNGIYNFETKELFPFSSNERFFSKLKWDYTELNQILYDQIINKVIYGTFGKIRGDYYLRILARALAGDVYDKIFAIIIGNGNSGKGVNCDLLENTFGPFVGVFNAGQLCKKTSTGDEAKSKSWIVPLALKRIISCNEIPVGQQLDSGVIKSLASGGDTHTGRQNYKDESSFKIQCTPFAFLNDMPNISGADDAIKNRMRYLETQSIYKSPSEYELTKSNPMVKLADPDIKTNFITNTDVLQTFALLVCSFYSTSAPEIPECVLVDSNDWDSSDNINNKINELIEITGNENDYISFKHLFNSCNSGGITISKTKLGKILKDLGIEKAQKKINNKTILVYKNIRFNNNE